MSVENTVTIGIDLGTTNSCVAVMEKGGSKSNRKHGRRTYYPIFCRYCRQRNYLWPECQKPNCHQP